MTIGGDRRNTHIYIVSHINVSTYLTLNGSGCGKTSSLETTLDGITKRSVGELEEGIRKLLFGGISTMTADGDIVRLPPFGRSLGRLLLLLLVICALLFLAMLGQIHGTGAPSLLVRPVVGTTDDLIEVLGVGPHSLHLVTVALSSLDLLRVGLEPLGFTLTLLLLFLFLLFLLCLELLVGDAKCLSLCLELSLPPVSLISTGR